MSDSEDEAAFQSADEGEETSKTSKTKRSMKSEGDPQTGEKKKEAAAAEAQPSSGSGQSPKKNQSKSKGKQAEKKKAAKKPSSNKQSAKKADNPRTDSDKPDSSSMSQTDKISESPTEINDKLAELDIKDSPGDSAATSVSEPVTSPDKEPTEITEVEKPATDRTEELSSTEGVKESSAPVLEQPSASADPNTEQSSTPEPEKQAQTPAKTANNQSGGWGGWGSWGSSLLNTVQSSVDTFASSVGEGLNTVLETAETALGAPDPKELAAEKNKLAKEVKGDALETPVEDKGHSELIPQKEPDPDETHQEKGAEGKSTEGNGSWLGSWGTKNSWGLSGISDMVQSTSKNLVTGTLDVLETVGKKTFETLAEGDHGLKNVIKRSGNKQNLSQLLREAKEEASERAKLEEEYEESRKANFGALFDESQGLVHLEALEMLSNQCEVKVQALLGSLPAQQQQTIKAALIAIKEAFQLEDLDDEDEVEDQDFNLLVGACLKNLAIGLNPDKLLQARDQSHEWVNTTTERDWEKKEAKEIHQRAMQSLAEVSARTVETFHKVGELVLMKKGDVDTNITRAKELASLTRVMVTEVGILSSRFSRCLNTTAIEATKDQDLVNPLITIIYLEAGNSSTYIQEAFQLLLPTLQQAVLESMT